MLHSDRQVNRVTQPVSGSTTEAETAREAAVVVLTLALFRVAEAIVRVSLIAFHFFQVPAEKSSPSLNHKVQALMGMGIQPDGECE